MNRLRREVSRLERGTDEYVKKNAELQKVKKYYNEIRAEMNGLPSLMERLTKNAGALVAAFGVGLGVNRITQEFRRIKDLAAELADLQADVMKTTGMTRAEVRELTKELDKIDTRSSREDLLAIATEGGRIGLAKEEIFAFTEALDKANVALGDTFADASEVANVLGKLRGLFQETRQMGVAEAYNAIGSAINELGASGVATEKNLAEFATRVGSLPDALKPSVAEALALGAAFEESGIEAQVAGRSYSILIQTAAKNAGAFAEIMGVTKETVEALIDESPVEFFLQFTKSMQQVDKSGVKTAKVLDSLGVSADGVNKIIGAGSSANDRFRQSLEISTRAMEEGTSMANEFNVKNENLAATVEKINKTFVEFVTADRVVDFVESLVEWFAMLIGATDKADHEMNRLQKTLTFSIRIFGVLIASFVSYHAATQLATILTGKHTASVALNTLATRGAAAAQKIWTGIVLIFNAVIQLFRRNVNRATASLRLFNMTLRMNPLGVVISLLTAAYAAYQMFKKGADDAANAQKNFAQHLEQANQSAAKSISGTVNQIKSLINVIKDENISLESRKRAYQELIKIAPEFNGFLKDEEFNIKGLTAVYDRYIARLQEVARVKALLQVSEEAAADVVKTQIELYQVENKLANERAKLQNVERYSDTPTPRKTRDGGFDMIYEENREYIRLTKSIEELEKRQRALQNTLKSNLDVEKQIGQFKKEQIQNIDEEIGLVEKRIEVYSKIDTEVAKNIVKNNESLLKSLKERRALLLGVDSGSDGMGEEFDFNIGVDDKEKEKIKKHLEQIWNDILATEKEKNAELLKMQRQARDERIEQMDEGYEKEVAKLEAQNADRINDLRIEIEARNQLINELEDKAREEASHGHHQEANEYRRLASEQIKIIDEKNEIILLSEETTNLKRRKIWLDTQTKMFEDQKKEIEDREKQFERDLMNLETRHNNELKGIKDLEAAKSLLRDQYNYSDEELSKLKDFEKAKSEIVLAQSKETYELQSEELQKQIQTLNDLIASNDMLAETPFGALFSEEQREQVLLFIDELKNKLSQLNEPTGDNEDPAAENKRLGSFIDIFGFTADEWQSTFENLDTMSGKIKLAQMSVQALMSAWNMFYQAQQRNMQMEMDAFTQNTNRKKEALASQLEEGYISQEVYNAKVAKLDAELDKKRAEMEYESAMQEWQMGLAQAAINTAVGITSALAMTPPNPVLAGIVAGIGAIQAGLILGQKPRKPQGYFGGGETRGSGIRDEYGRELADGPVHANEYVIPEYLRRDPIIAQMEEFIEARRRGMNPTSISRPNEGYFDGGETRPDPAPSTPDDSDMAIMMLTPAINELVEVLKDLRDNPIEAKLSRTMETAKRLKEDIDDYNSHRNKNKR